MKNYLLPLVFATLFTHSVYADSEMKRKDIKTVEDVKEYHIDTFCIGDDWEGEFDFLKEHCEVNYLKRTKGISTTKIKKDLGM